MSMTHLFEAVTRNFLSNLEQAVTEVDFWYREKLANSSTKINFILSDDGLDAARNLNL